MAAHGDAVGKARHPHAEGLQQSGDVQRRGLALGVGVGGHDNLADAALCHPIQQGLDLKIVRPHVVHGGQHAVEHVVMAVELPAALDSQHVTGVGHHADDRLVPLGVGAHAAQAARRQVAAHRAQRHAPLGLDNGVGEAFRLLHGQIQHVEGQTLGGFSADARQTGELLHQLFKGRGKVFHGC